VSLVQDVRPSHLTVWVDPRGKANVPVSFAYIAPGNLTNAFPFFADVTDVRSFDAAALNYFSNPFQWEATKFENQLGCSNASDAVLRYQRTVLCSNWVNNQWSRECLSLYSEYHSLRQI
jgi:hypothetical protein